MMWRVTCVGPPVGDNNKKASDELLCHKILNVFCLFRALLFSHCRSHIILSDTAPEHLCTSESDIAIINLLQDNATRCRRAKENKTLSQKA